MSELTKNLLKVQNELKAPKNQYNSFGKYKYRSAEDILEAVKPLNAENGLLLTITDEPILIGERHYIKATAHITDGEATHEVSGYAREAENKKGQDDSQITGTASSYARKYALNGLYLIDDTKDADTDEYQNQNKQSNNQSKQQNPITSEQVGDIKTKVMQFSKARNGSPDKVYEALKITDITKLNESQASAAIKQLDVWLSNVKQGA